MSDAVVHIIGLDVLLDGHLLRQRCAWCGHLLVDDDQSMMMMPLNDDGSVPDPPGAWPVGALVEVFGSSTPAPGEALGFRGMTIVEPEDGLMPENCCARLDPEVTR
jgi:hypothetical protein